ncbi:MAG: hypothetical protein JNL83_11315 [Myxococcales bacterium]|nr:hypothetical protein [Myxococcales bacterium]
MPAKEEKQPEAQDLQAPQLVAPVEVPPAPQAFHTEGDLPAVEQGGPTPMTATASQLAFAEKPKADSAAIDHGMFQPEEYKHACEASGNADKWQDKYRNGYTASTHWSAGKHPHEFTLKKGHSASAAIEDFMKGPTIADFRVISVADQLDELRDELGDATFDRLFGSAGAHDSNIPAQQRLHISSEMYTTPFVDQMKAIAREDEEKHNKPEAEEPKASTPEEEQKQPRPKAEAQQARDEDLDEIQSDMGFASDDLQRM